MTDEEVGALADKFFAALFDIESLDAVGGILPLDNKFVELSGLEHESAGIDASIGGGDAGDEIAFGLREFERGVQVEERVDRSVVGGDDSVEAGTIG